MTLLRLQCSPGSCSVTEQLRGALDTGTWAHWNQAELGSGMGTTWVWRQEAELGEEQVDPSGISRAKAAAGKLQHKLQNQLRLRTQTTWMQVGCLHGHPPSPHIQQIQAGGPSFFECWKKNPSVLQLQSAVEIYWWHFMGQCRNKTYFFCPKDGYIATFI